jgi:hypothetical protein
MKKHEKSLISTAYGFSLKPELKEMANLLKTDLFRIFIQPLNTGNPHG